MPSTRPSPFETMGTPSQAASKQPVASRRTPHACNCKHNDITDGSDDEQASDDSSASSEVEVLRKLPTTGHYTYVNLFCKESEGEAREREGAPTDPIDLAQYCGLHGPASFLSEPENKKRTYIMFNGSKSEVYEEWATTHTQVASVPGSSHQTFSSWEDALRHRLHSTSNGAEEHALTRRSPDLKKQRRLPAEPANVAGPSKSKSKPRAITESDASPDPLAKVEYLSPKMPAATSAKSRSGKLKAHKPATLRLHRYRVDYGGLSAEHRYSYQRTDPFSRPPDPFPRPRDMEIYVVIRGQFPGVYRGKAAATAAIGISGPGRAAGLAHMVGDLQQGFQVFVECMMQGQVQWFSLVKAVKQIDV